MSFESGADALVPDELSGGLIVERLGGRTSVADLAYDAIRGAILRMDVYDPGAELRLDEKRIAADLGVSRTPVRLAFARLELEGLVQIVARRGVYIVRKTKDEIVEMITVWAALEGMAGRLACTRATDAEIARLRGLFAEFGAETVRLYLDEYSTANLRFHQHIIELGHSPLIAQMAARLLAHVRAIRRHAIRQEDRVERSMVDHEHIIEALEARDPELTERRVRDHALNLAAHVQRVDDYLD